MEPNLRGSFPKVFFILIALVTSLLTAGSCIARQRIVANLPDAPTPKQQPTEVQSKPNTDHKEPALAIVSRRSFFFPDLAHTDKPLTGGQKFLLATYQSVAPSTLIVAAMAAGINQARDSWPGYGQGWEAYGTRVGYSMARASSTSFFGTFVFASIFHQDPRFFPESHPSFFRAIKYSAVRIVVTRNDKGKDVFNSSGLLGPLAAEALSNSYLPRSEQTGARTMERYGSDLAWRFAANVFKEYWPTIFRDMHLQKVMPNPGSGR